jgi:3-hydroxybutyryl-CoA dehydrogenase
MDSNTICIIGGGIRGRAIAYLAALGGYATRLVDVSDQILQAAHQEIERALDAGRAGGKLADSEASAALERISLHSDLDQGSAPAACVIEAMPELLKLKLETFGRLSDYCAPEAILATTTVALSQSEIATVVARPNRVLGLHFFNPLAETKLVEIVRGLETDEVSVQTAREVAERLGKEPVVIRESPGFVTQRMHAVEVNEAFFMLQEGVASAEAIDRAIKFGLNHAAGPLERADAAGLDKVLDTLRHLHATLGEKYRPCPLLEQYVRAGWAGRKTGRGVFDHPRP